MALIVGIPKEIKPLEKRVGLTPSGVKLLADRGIEVWVERGAGEASSFPDSEYDHAGGRLIDTAAFLYRGAGLIQKVKEPQAVEFPLLWKGQLLFSFLHLASPENAPVVKACREQEVTAIAYETVAVDGKNPILKPMSEIAGGLSAVYAGLLAPLRFDLPAAGDLFKELESLATLFPEMSPGLCPGRVVIWGGGAAGQKALEYCLKMKAEVLMIEKMESRRREIEKLWADRGRLVVMGPEAIPEDALRSADVFIGAVHQTGERALRVLDDERLRGVCQEKRKVIMDIAIDQGGNFPEAHATTYENPVYEDSLGNLRFSVANIPSLCGREASRALTEASAVYSQAMAEGLEPAFYRFPELKSAVCLSGGKIQSETLQQIYGP